MFIFDPSQCLPDNFSQEGLLIPVDKPYGWTSTDVVRKIQYLMRRRTGNRNVKVGHAGTLDPLATGVLLICVGAATKQAQTLLDQDKEYIATIRFGVTTASFDMEKPVDEVFPHDHIDAQAVVKSLKDMTGLQDQVPPIFSAKMVGGVRSYELARKGKEVELVANSIRIVEAELLTFIPGKSVESFIPEYFPATELPDQFPKAVVRIRCSKGTYIRSFARDLGLALASGGHLADLRRIKSGVFTDVQLFEIKTIEQYFAN
jgi:tRNA pseudouridine55 synthase